MNTCPTSNAEAQMTHAAWAAAPCMDFDALEEFEVAERWKRASTRAKRHGSRRRTS